MTRLKMHWEFVQGADGRKFLGMRWEAAQAGEMPACGHSRIKRLSARKVA